MDTSSAHTSIPWRVIFAVIGAVLLTAVGLLLVWKLQRVLTWLAVASFLAVVLTQPVAWAQRRLHLRRALAVVLVLAVVFGAVAGAIYLLVEPLVGEAQEFVDNFPQYVDDAEAGRGKIGELAARLNLDDWVRDNRATLGDSISKGSGPALDLARSAANVVVAVLTILVLTVLLMLEAPTMMQRGLAMLPPARRDRVARVAAECSRTVSGYVAGNLLISVIAGTVAFVSLTVLGVPFAAPLAVWVALADLIPLVGATLGAIPSVIVAFLHSVPAGIIVLAVFILYQQFENHVLQVTIMSRTVQLNPLLVLVSVLVGVELFGFVGALLAIPAAGVIQVIVRDVYANHHPPLADDEAEVIAEQVEALTGENPSPGGHDDDGPGVEGGAAGSDGPQAPDEPAAARPEVAGGSDDATSRPRGSGTPTG
jgi:predicted PurR-regulated permease PerM